MTKVLITGGARSGKSLLAEQRLSDYSVVDYVATSQPMPTDPEWQDRVAKHRQRRPASWRTIETFDLASVLGCHDSTPVLIDCLGVWLARAMDQAGCWNDQPQSQQKLTSYVQHVVTAFATTERDVIAVTNEVGLGLVPDNPGGRLYRDELGRLNAHIAQVCDQVILAVCGIGMTIK